MPIQCLFAVCALAVVVAGMLIMTQAISLEHMATAIGRGLLGGLVSLIMLCVLKGILFPALIAVASWAKRLALGFAIMALVAMAVVLLVRILIF
jgi:hypothetical protein